MTSKKRPTTSGAACEPCLVMTGDEPLHILLDEGETRIGRGEACDVVLSDRSVSTEHCRVIRTGVEVRVYDSGSRNGTGIDGAPAGGRQLTEGSVLAIGRYRLTYHEGKAIVAPPSVTPEAPSPLAGATGGNVRAPARPSRRSSRPSAQTWIVRSGMLGGMLAGVLVLGLLGLAYLFATEGLESLTARLFPEVEPEIERVVEIVEVPSPIEGELLAELQDVHRMLREKETELEAARQQHEGAIARLRQLADEATAGSVERDRYQEEIRRLEAEQSDLASARSDLQSRVDDLEERYRQALVAAEEARQEKRVTVARPRATGGAWLAEKDIDRLVADVRELLERYADPTASPSALAALTAPLVDHPGRYAAERLLDAYAHGCDLLEEVDDNARGLERRNASLWKKVKEEGDSSGSSARRARDLQVYELSAKKLEILGRQRDKLRTLLDGILDAFRAMRAEDSVRALVRGAVERERDSLFVQAVCDAVVTANARHAFEELVDLLRAKNDESAEAAHAALVELTGQDFGTKSRAWKQWATDQGLQLGSD